MYCFQCEQTAKGSGCTVAGVCGKDAQTAALQDLLVHAVKGISMYAHRAAKLGKRDPSIDVFVVEALFTTITNVDFDPQRLEGILRKAAGVRDKAKALYENACKETDDTPETLPGAAAWEPAGDLVGLTSQGEEVSILSRRTALGEDLSGLQELILYGIKGLASYLDHAQILGQDDPAVYATLANVPNGVRASATTSRVPSHSSPVRSAISLACSTS